MAYGEPIDRSDAERIARDAADDVRHDVEAKIRDEERERREADGAIRQEIADLRQEIAELYRKGAGDASI